LTVPMYRRTADCDFVILDVAVVVLVGNF
jgi:hypothetical protein